MCSIWRIISERDLAFSPCHVSRWTCYSKLDIIIFLLLNFDYTFRVWPNPPKSTKRLICYSFTSLNGEVLLGQTFIWCSNVIVLFVMDKIYKWRLLKLFIKLTVLLTERQSVVTVIKYLQPFFKTHFSINPSSDKSQVI